MGKRDTALWLADVVEPLFSQLGDRLTLDRDGGCVRWTCDGRSAVVEMRSDGALDATFIDRPSVDCVSAAMAAPLYRRSGFGYALSVEGCSRMARDLVDFFTGIREPHFRFVGTRTLDVQGT